MAVMPRHDLQALVAKAKAEHDVFARECEAMWCDELEKRRLALSAELSRVLAKLRDAS
jgi:hypothetical protein